MRIEFLYWEECPSHEEALRRLNAVLQEAGVTEPVEIIRVETEQQAAALHFPGSPTIRFDGEDIQPEGAHHTGAALTCRAYRVDGRISPLPTKAMIAHALEKARRRAMDNSNAGGESTAWQN